MTHDCDRFRCLVEPWLDEELPVERREELERHLAECAACSRHFAAARSIQSGLSTLGRAADAMAAPVAGSSRPAWHANRLLRIAAAIVVLAAAGLTWRLTAREGQRAEPQPLVAADPPEPRGATPPARSKATRAIVADAGGALAVPIESDNPRVQIVMFYAPAELPVPAGSISTAPSHF